MIVNLISINQGSPEWLALRKTKITSTDAGVIMGVNPWKTPLQLYNEKISNDPPKPSNEAMRRGIELEPIARDLFNLKTGLEMIPKVYVNDWTMASLDGASLIDDCILEIKCPGEKDHTIALSGKIPEHYFPQLQHAMYVANARGAYYYSFDGIDGVIVPVKRDDDYIEKMLVEEKKFYECLLKKTPPEPTERDYVEKTDFDWESCAERWKEINAKISALQDEEEVIRKKLIAMCNNQNSQGFGIKLAQISRKGNVDYGKIPELKNVDLEQYRKASIVSWRITK